MKFLETYMTNARAETLIVRNSQDYYELEWLIAVRSFVYRV